MATNLAPPPQPHWTVAQVAARWGRQKYAVYAAIRSGELPAIQLGPKSIRIRQVDLDTYEAAHRMPTPRAPKLDPETVAFLSELAEKAPALSERQKDAVRAAFR